MERSSHPGRRHRQASSLIFPIKAGGFASVLISDASHRVGSADHKSGGHENQDWMVAVWGSRYRSGVAPEASFQV